MAIGSVKIITLLVSKGFFFFFFREIFTLMIKENSSILEVIPEDNGFCSAALNLCTF